MPRTLEKPPLRTVPRVPRRAVVPAAPLTRGVGQSRRLRQAALALLAVGLACRLLRYALRFPYWGDEAFLCVNFLDRDYLGLTRRLECFQVAPVLFLWGELTAFRLLGASELALRFLPLLAGVGSLGLFWHLARTTLGPRPAALAVGILAVARWPVTMGASVKPYSFDLFFSLVLLTAAVRYLRQPGRVGWLVLLTLLVPVALLGSYPAAFVAGGVSLVLLPAAWRGGRPARAWFAAYNLLVLGTFLGAYLLVGLNQLDADTGSVGRYMREYWKDEFPPAAPLRLAAWLARLHAGRLMAFPVGDANGGSVLTLLCFVAGVRSLARRGRWALLGLCLLPFVLNLAAAALRSYPYGGGRVSQHLAPAVCLLAGAGLSRLIDRVARSSHGRFRAVYFCCGAFALFGLGQGVADVAKPYRDAEALWSRKLTDLLLCRRAADRVVVGSERAEVESLLRWHLGRLGGRVGWGGRVDWERLEGEGGDLWCVSIWSGLESTPEGERRGVDVAVDRAGWTRTEHADYTLTPWSDGQPLRRCEVSHWVRRGKAAAPAPFTALGAWPP